MLVYLWGCFDRKHPRVSPDGDPRPWRERVMLAFEGQPSIRFLDPELKSFPGDELPSRYVSWDLQAIKLADVCFGAIQREAPHAHGFACELGFATALGKPSIVAADPQCISRHEYQFMWGMPGLALFGDLRHAIEYLEELVRPVVMRTH